MTQAEYLTRLHAPVRVLDMRVPRRACNARDVDMRAERAAALVEARAKCECADAQDDERVARIMRDYTRQLDIQHKRDAQEQREEQRDDTRVARILDGYTRYLDAEQRRTQRKAQRKSRAQRYNEYLNRCAARARESWSRAWRASQVRSAQPSGVHLAQPGPLVQVGPATQPSPQRSAQPYVEPQPSRSRALTYRMANKLRRVMATFEAAMPQPEQILTAYDYTTPIRDGVQLSTMEEHKMDRDDLIGLDDSQQHEICATQRGMNSMYLPTHASMAANAMCSCSYDDTPSCVGMAVMLEHTCYAPQEGAKPGSLPPSRRSQGTQATLCAPEVRF